MAESPQLQAVFSRLEGVRKNGAGWMAKCPAHSDTNPSLSIRQGDKAIILYCFVGCTINAILDAIGLTPADLFYDQRDHSCQPAKPKPKKEQSNHWGHHGYTETSYDIRNRAGELVAEHVRRDWPDKPKLFRWYRNGQWNLGGLSTKDLPLYRVEHLPDDPAGISVYVTEGEKACDALRERGYHAVATVCGSSTIPIDEQLYQLLGWDVVYLWPDCDEPGRKHMDGIADRLLVMGVDFKLIRIPWAQPGDDAHDFYYSASQKEGERCQTR